MATPADTPLLLDVMVGKLATYLRMCGYDAAYALDRDVEADDELLAWADREDRVVLTRDAELAGRAGEAVLLSALDVTDQLVELRAAGFELSLTEPARCANCNGELREIEAREAGEEAQEGAETPEHVPDPTERRVWRCPDCGQYFWRGSHWADVEETVAEIDPSQR